jgi:L-threonylcarbamoyladenylate synthase
MYSFDPTSIKILKKDGIGIVPTDTLYGVVGSAYSKRAVEKIYDIKGRDDNKPFIVLITDIKELSNFGVKLAKEQEIYLDKVWPGKVTVILPLEKKVLKQFHYLHRGANSIAFRMISKRNKNLFNILKSVGPLVAPSANPQGKEPAKTVWEAKKYFQQKVDFYLCGGTRAGKPSTIISLVNGEPVILRK